MPQRTRVFILLVVTTVFGAVVLVVISALKPERFGWYVREFGGLLTLGWAAWLVEGVFRRLTARPLRAAADGPAAPGERTRLTLALAAALAAAAAVGAFILQPWWQAPMIGGGALVALGVWFVAGRRSSCMPGGLQRQEPSRKRSGVAVRDSRPGAPIRPTSSPRRRRPR